MKARCKSLMAMIAILSLAPVLSHCGNDKSTPGYEVFKDMKHSVPYDTFAPNPNTKDGKTLQAPVEGTIPRGFEPYHYVKSTEDAARAGRELVNPLPLTPDTVARGKVLYNRFCAPCHGIEGNGDGPVAGKYPKPRSFTNPYMNTRTAGHIYHVIARGNFVMPSYATQISPEDRWKIVHYVEQEIQKKTANSQASQEVVSQ